MYSSGYYKCTGGEFKGQEEKCLIIITPVINYVNVVVQLDQTNIMIIGNVLLFLVKKQINWVQNLIKQGNLFANSFPSDLGLWSCYNGVINRLHKNFNIFCILRINAVILGVS